MVPVGAECVPFLRAAVAASPSELVFPRMSGARRGEMLDGDALDLPTVVRRALADAGVVESWLHVCRARVNAAGERDRTAPRCTHTEAAADRGLRRCPVHGDKLWPKAQVRQVTFHQLRHTTASLLMQRGVSAFDVQHILGHSDVTVTLERYAHMDPPHLRSAVDRLTFEASAESDTAPPVRVAASASGASGVARCAGVRQGRDPRSRFRGRLPSARRPERRKPRGHRGFRSRFGL